MVREPFKHSFASYLLSKSNVEIFSGKNKLLKTSAIFNYPHYEPTLTIGRRIVTEKQSVQELKRYEDITRLGYQICQKQVRPSDFNGRRIEFFIVKKTQSNVSNDYGRVPDFHHFEIDLATGHVRIRGRNSRSLWTNFNRKFIERQSRSFNPYGFNKFQTYQQDYMKNLYPFKIEDERKLIKIKEIPVMILKDGRLCCIPELRDNPVMGILGSRGTGKSTFMHSLCDNLYHHWKKRLILANDVNRETWSWCLPWKQQKFIDDLKKINSESIPLPVVYLHPNTDTLKIVTHEGEVGFRISIPFSEVIKDYTNFFKGSPELDLDKSAIYMKNLIYDDKGDIRKDGLAKAKTMKEVIGIVQSIQFELSRVKIENLMRYLNNTKSFDISNGIPAKWKMVTPEGEEIVDYPWNICLLNDLVPSIVTSELKKKEFFPHFFRFVLNDLYNKQTEDINYLKNRLELFIMVDECQRLFEHSVSAEILERIIREGRMARTGLGYVVQNSSEVPSGVRNNTNYVFAFSMKSEQAKSVCSDFDTLEGYEKDIKSLQKFECILATNEQVVIYDNNGNKQTTNEPVRGYIIPPLSQHSAPKKVEDEDEQTLLNEVVA